MRRLGVSEGVTLAGREAHRARDFQGQRGMPASKALTERLRVVGRPIADGYSKYSAILDFADGKQVSARPYRRDNHYLANDFDLQSCCTPTAYSCAADPPTTSDADAVHEQLSSCGVAPKMAARALSAETSRPERLWVARLLFLLKNAAKIIIRRPKVVR